MTISTIIIVLYFVVAACVFIILHGPRAEHLLFTRGCKYDIVFISFISYIWPIIIVVLCTYYLLDTVVIKIETRKLRKEDMKNATSAE